MRRALIVVRPLKGKYRFGFEVEGHADFAPHGQDIVCAGVSMLTQSCSATLADYHAEISKHSGFMHVAVPEPTHDTSLLIRSMLKGLGMLKKLAPDYIKIEGETTL